MSDERWVSRRECATHLGVSLDTLDRLVRDEELPSKKLTAAPNGARRFWLPDVDEWVRAREEEPAA